jgi:poly-gamma-glutamate synthesis protein (capsule biosynthesis protein)
MLPTRSIAFMTLGLACVFSISAVLGAIFLPSVLPEWVVKDQWVALDQSDLYSETASTAQTPPAHLLFVGDIMLARGVEWRVGKNDLSYPFKNVTEFLSAPDLTIGNFEGTIRYEPNQELDGFTFDTTPAIAKTVAEAGVDVLSLSNNHSDNHGAAIVQYTRDTIAGLGMTPFGDPYDSAHFVAHKTVGTTTFAFIGFHAFGEESESILDAIRAEKVAGNFVIVFPHWGNEYESTPSVAQTDAAHLFVDAGADAIIGAHPHVIQTYENYQGVPIVYSLGNFLFDQDWSVPTQQGLALGFDVAENTITMTFIPISVTKSQPKVMNADDAMYILSEHNLPITLTIER